MGERTQERVIKTAPVECIGSEEATSLLPEAFGGSARTRTEANSSSVFNNVPLTCYTSIYVHVSQGELRLNC